MSAPNLLQYLYLNIGNKVHHTHLLPIIKGWKFLIAFLLMFAVVIIDEVLTKYNYNLQYN